MRVMNPSEYPIQLHAVQKIMQIIAVIESTTGSRSLEVEVLERQLVISALALAVSQS